MSSATRSGNDKNGDSKRSGKRLTRPVTAAKAPVGTEQRQLQTAQASKTAVAVKQARTKKLPTAANRTTASVGVGEQPFAKAQVWNGMSTKERGKLIEVINAKRAAAKRPPITGLNGIDELQFADVVRAVRIASLETSTAAPYGAMDDIHELSLIHDDAYFDQLRQKFKLEAPWSLGQLRDATISANYLIEDCLIAGEPAVTAGASKTLKTTLEVGRTLSLISERPFLGKFRVAKKCRVFFASAESGKGTLQRTFSAMARAMNIDAHDLDAYADSVTFSWWVPKVSIASQLGLFLHDVEECGADVAIIDPLYQVLTDSQSSMVLTGQQLGDFCNALLDLGVTPILVDHVKRSSQNAREHQPIGLEDISGAGKAEYFRQWTLLNRRKGFASEQSESSIVASHLLWLTFGGSAGHSSEWALDVTETNKKDEYKTREYAIEARPRAAELGNLRVQEDENKLRKQEEREREQQRKEANFLAAAFADGSDEPKSQSAIQTLTGCDRKAAKRMLAKLIEKGLVVNLPKALGRGKARYDGYVRARQPGLSAEGKFEVNLDDMFILPDLDMDLDLGVERDLNLDLE